MWSLWQGCGINDTSHGCKWGSFSVYNQFSCYRSKWDFFRVQTRRLLSSSHCMVRIPVSVGLGTLIFNRELRGCRRLSHRCGFWLGQRLFYRHWHILGYCGHCIIIPLLELIKVNVFDALIRRVAHLHQESHLLLVITIEPRSLECFLMEIVSRNSSC